MKKYVYKGLKYGLKELEAVLGRSLSRVELMTLQREGVCGDISTVYEISTLYRRPVRGNVIVFRWYEGRVVALCPLQGRQSDDCVPVYDGQWRWLDYYRVLKDSTAADADPVLKAGCEAVYGASRVVTKCRPCYPIHDRVKRKYVKKNC